MDILQQWLDNSTAPVITAFILGLMTALSPCPLATNITATAYLSKDISDKHKVFLNGLSYLAGSIFSYTVLGIILYIGSAQLSVAAFLMNSGWLFMSIILIITGIMITGFIPVQIQGWSVIPARIKKGKFKRTYTNAFLLGILFALAFCPLSGLLYFGVLMPMVVASKSGMLLLPVFAFAMSLPVVVIAYIIAYCVGEIGLFYDRVKAIERYSKYVMALIFISAGVYLLINNI